MDEAMHVAGLTVPAGSAARQTIEIAELADGTTLTLPLWLMQGITDGPRLYLGAAIHGDEVTGIEILARACAQVQEFAPLRVGRQGIGSPTHEKVSCIV